jgi:hypothetical protein
MDQYQEKWSEETIKQVVTMGVMGYDTPKILNIMEPSDPAEMKRELETEGTKLQLAYKKGIDQREFRIDKAIWDKVKEGDLQALNKWEERRAYKEV